MKRKAVALILGVALLTGCSSTIVYNEKERPTEEVEEIISDQLEVENPGLDIEVSIQQQQD